MNICEKLSAIQSEVRATKNRTNDFGGFSYRSAEDILEAVKPVCKNHKAVLLLSDSIELVGERYYVRATAILTDVEKPSDSVSAEAYAREALSRPKMDDAQLTGSASSYARKYALNGLFNLDDNKDADDTEYTKAMEEAKKEESNAKIVAQEQADKTISKAEETKLRKLIEKKDANDPVDVRIQKICKAYGVNALSELKKSQFLHLCGALSK